MGNAEKQTRQKIMTIAREHFSRYGYAGTNLEAIGKEAGMTRGPLYYYVKRHWFPPAPKFIEPNLFAEDQKMKTETKTVQTAAG